MPGDLGFRSWQGICSMLSSSMNFFSSLYSTCMAAAIHYHSCFNEFLPYLHPSDLFTNSLLTREKDPPPHGLRSLPKRSCPTTSSFWILSFLIYKMKGVEFWAPRRPSSPEVQYSFIYILSIASELFLLNAINFSPVLPVIFLATYVKDDNYAYASLYSLSCWQGAFMKSRCSIS